ncbi:MAG TPA: cation-transporting P-type ATPase, partial [Polyangia bacterium]|nr:cation-transporting P-type ATPase [Polyangia bacterium]
MSSSAAQLPDAAWTAPVPALLGNLAARLTGLTTAEAVERRAVCGANVVAGGRRLSVLLELLLRFKNPLILLLLGAAAIAGFSGDGRSSSVILVMVILSVVLDFVQEHRAGRAAERLRRSAHVKTTVLRDGVAADLPVEDIVPGDVCVLSAGDLVPADARLLEARDLFVNQSLLTGEPYPIEKHAH